MDEQIRLDPKRTAFVVIDMQNDYGHPDGFNGRRGQPVELVRAAIDPILSVLDAARRQEIFTVFVSVIRQGEGFPDIPQLHTIKPPHFTSIGKRLIKGSWGAQLIDELVPQGAEISLEKHAYSSFYQTDLELMLRRKGISTVILAGTATHCCVLHTAFDAFVRDFDVIVVRDGTAAFSPELHASALQIIEALIGPALTADEIVQLLEAPVPAD